MTTTVDRRSRFSIGRVLCKFRLIAAFGILVVFDRVVAEETTARPLATIGDFNGASNDFNSSKTAENFTTRPSTVFRNSSTDEPRDSVTVFTVGASIAPNGSTETTRNSLAAIYQLPRVVRDLGWVIALITLSSVGIVCVLAIEVWLLIKTLAVRRTSSPSFQSMWLGQVLLFGIFCSYLTLFAFLPFSSPVTCGIIRFCVGICYALCFSVLVVKLLLILDSKSGLQDVSRRFQVVLLFFAWAVQLVIDIQWLISSPPKMQLQGPSRIDSEPWGACDPGFALHVQSLVYVMFLVVLCVLLALCAHGNRTNHSEGLLIGLAAGVTIGIWIVWILLGFLMNDHSWHEPCIAFGLLTTVTWILIIMFVPKLYHLHKITTAEPLSELYASRTAGLYPRAAYDAYRGTSQSSRHDGHLATTSREEESVSRSMKFGDEAPTVERRRQNGSSVSTSGTRPNECIYDPRKT